MALVLSAWRVLYGAKVLLLAVISLAAQVSHLLRRVAYSKISSLADRFRLKNLLIVRIQEVHVSGALFFAQIFFRLTDTLLCAFS